MKTIQIYKDPKTNKIKHEPIELSNNFTSGINMNKESQLRIPNCNEDPQISIPEGHEIDFTEEVVDEDEHGETNNVEIKIGKECQKRIWRKAYVKQRNTDTSEIFKRQCGQDLLLQASIQLVENAHYYEQEVRKIFHMVRNCKNSGVVKVDEILPMLHQLVLQDKRPLYLSEGVSILMNGWAYISRMKRKRPSNTKSISEGMSQTKNSKSSSFLPWQSDTLVRQQMWIVLWDGKLGCFSNEESSEKYILALSKAKRGSINHIGARMLKEYAPDMIIDILGCQLQTSEQTNSKKHSNITLPPHSISLWPIDGKEQYVLECESSTEYTAWSDHLFKEAQSNLINIQNKLQSYQGEQYIHYLSHKPIYIPIRWLRLYVDLIDIKARKRRLHSANIRQALKDLERESTLKINGKLFQDAYIEDIISELAVSIVQKANESMNSSKGSLPSSTCKLIQEVEAVQFARRVLIYGARTQGGGDILESIQLLLLNPYVCIVPDTSKVEPVEIYIEVDKNNQLGRLIVKIIMKMSFKIFPTSSMSDEQCMGNILGTSYQEIYCQLPDVQGHVVLNVQDTQEIHNKLF